MTTARVTLALLLSLVFAVHLLAAQGGPPASVPEIVTSATGTVSLPPDRAVLRIGVATRAATASAASTPNGPLVTRVQDTIRVLNLPGRPVRVISFGVAPNYDFQRARQIIDYEARTTLEVILHDVASLGRLLDAVLAAGATDITGISFESDSTSAARHRALAAALTTAREDAEALAKAAGGRLGPLRLLTTTPDLTAGGIGFRDASMTGPPSGIPAVRRDVMVYVMVQGRWAFIP